MGAVMSRSGARRGGEAVRRPIRWACSPRRRDTATVRRRPARTAQHAPGRPEARTPRSDGGAVTAETAPSMGDVRRAALAMVEVGVGRVMAFGSVALGRSGLRSDIDLAAVDADLDHDRQWEPSSQRERIVRSACGFRAEVLATDEPESTAPVCRAARHCGEPFDLDVREQQCCIGRGGNAGVGHRCQPMGTALDRGPRRSAGARRVRLSVAHPADSDRCADVAAEPGRLRIVDRAIPPPPMLCSGSRRRTVRSRPRRCSATLSDPDDCSRGAHEIAYPRRR